MEMTVSIIVPVYNVENTLERCVRSLMAQTLRSIEIILVNDGSPDRSPEICRQLASEDGRIRVIDKPNGGISSARNAGLDAARGEYILFCDSDDWVEPDWCESMVNAYKPGDLVVCDIDRNGVREEQSAELAEAERREILHYPSLSSYVWNKLFLRSVIEEAGLRFQVGLTPGEDVCFVLAYLCLIDGKLRFLLRKLYHYDLTTVGSLSKRIPTLEQIDTYYRLMTAPMLKLGATDERSLENRCDRMNWHYRLFLEQTEERQDLSSGEKIRIAGKVSSLESFRRCCGSLRWDQHPIYLRLYHTGHARLLMAFQLLRQQKQKIQKALGIPFK